MQHILLLEKNVLDSTDFNNSEFLITEAESVSEAEHLCSTIKFDGIVFDFCKKSINDRSIERIERVTKAPVIVLCDIGKTRISDDEKFFITKGSIQDTLAKISSILNAVALKSKYVFLPDGYDTSHKFFIYKSLVIDLSCEKVFINKSQIKLRPKELDLLLHFVKNKNVPLSRKSILQDVWGYAYYDDIRTLDTHIKTLRHNLGSYKKMIVTLRGIGYIFNDICEVKID